MKYIYTLFVAFALSTNLAAQNTSNWLLEKDIVVGNDILRLAIKPVRQKEVVKYDFQLKLDEDNIKKFDIPSGSFHKGEYLEKLLYTHLLSKYKQIGHNNADTADQHYIDSIKALAVNRELTSVEKTAIEKIMTKLSAHPRIGMETFRQVFKGLKDSVREADSTWLATEMAKSEAVIESKWNNAQEDLQKLSASFLDEVFDILFVNQQTGPPTGILFVKEKIDIRVRDTIIKCPHAKIVDKDKGSSTDQPQLEKVQQQLKSAEKMLNDAKKLDTKGNAELIKKLESIVEMDSALLKTIQQNASTTPSKKGILSIQETQLRFENGQIDIIICGVAGDNGDRVIFLNRTPISYSTVADVSSDYHGNGGRRYKMYAMNANYNNCYIYLDDVIYNNFQVNNYSDNYSPADTTIKVKPNEPGRVVFKERVTDILQARIFTDLIGFNEDNPNGIVQVELSKRFFLSTRAKQQSKYRYCGAFNYIQPTFSLTKIENNQKYFIPQASGSNTNSEGKPVIGSIDLLRHANLISGANLNLVYFGGKSIHSVLYIDISANIMLTGIENQSEKVDTSGSFFTVNDNFLSTSLLFSPIILNWDVRPHPNYRVSFFYNWQNITSLDSRIQQEPKVGTQDIDQIGMIAAVKFNEEANGELFFRTRFSFVRNAKKENFFQAQIGYSFKVFSRRPSVRNRPVFYSGS